MKAPKCKLCRTEHWGLCNNVSHTECPTSEDVSHTPSTYKYRDKEKRRKYQRELMRKIRMGNK